MAEERVLFVTGRLAEPALRAELERLRLRVGFEPQVAVLGISVAALMTADWVAQHLQVPAGTSRVLLPGWCRGELAVVEQNAGVPVARGPKDLRDLPRYFGLEPQPDPDYGDYDLEIIAEINHCPRLSADELLGRAERYRAAGADVIDVGCEPGQRWPGLGDAVRRLRDRRFRVSIDSFDPTEVAAAVAAGAELVLSVNGSNVEAAVDWGCEVVVVPDRPGTMNGLDRTLQRLERAGVRYRIDPVLDPIGLGFAQALGRFIEARRRWPQAPMLMGIGNVTELTDVDSAGVNMILVAFCQELGITSVLTTEVVNWARSSVREIDVARRLACYAVRHRVPPKRLDQRLVMLRDARLHQYGPELLAELARRITDRNFRIFTEGGQVHVVNSRLHLTGRDPFQLFGQLQTRDAVDPAHAFYLGYEMAKATTALALGKNYTQDAPLDWGLLSDQEPPGGRGSAGP